MNTDVESELSMYSTAVAQINYSSVIDFWVANTTVVPTLAPLALDNISAPASQASSASFQCDLTKNLHNACAVSYTHLTLPTKRIV